MLKNGSKTPCKTHHAQSAILLHPNLCRLTEKNKLVLHKIGSCMARIVPVPRPSPCRWASAARRGWWTRTRAGLADPRSGKRAAVSERPAPAPWTTVCSFYSINLSDPLTITHKTATELMEEGGWRWRMRKNNGIEEIQRGNAEAGVCVFSRCLSAPFTIWRTLKNPQPTAFFPPPSHTPVNALRGYSRRLVHARAVTSIYIQIYRKES